MKRYQLFRRNGDSPSSGISETRFHREFPDPEFRAHVRDPGMGSEKVIVNIISIIFLYVIMFMLNHSCFRFDPNVRIPKNKETENDRILFVKTCVLALMQKARIKLNPRNLYMV